MVEIIKLRYIMIIFLSLFLVAAKVDDDYYEPYCEIDSDCLQVWNTYYVCKCINERCKWVKRDP
ncbi:unnamed protein product [Lathyrus oleraceus]